MPVRGRRWTTRFVALYAAIALAAAAALVVASGTAQAATATWNGADVDDSLWTSGDNWGGAAPSAGDDLVFGGSSRLTPVNDFAAGFDVASITFAAAAGAFSLAGNTVDLAAGGSITNASGVGQAIDLGLNLDGTATVATGTSTITVNGSIADGAGTGTLTKTGAGTLALNATNTATGATTVSAGSLASDAGAAVGGPLSVANTATLRPGGTGTAGTFSTGAATIAAGGTLAADVTGTGAADQLDVTGSVTVTGSTLSVNSVTAPGPGNSVTIVANDGVDAVVGTFTGLAEGAVLAAGTERYRVSYVGGTGNDIALTQVTVPGAPTGATATAGNTWASVAFTAPASDGGAPIMSYTVTASPGGTTATGASSPIVVAGLTNGTPYTFVVQATNGAGDSAASSASSAVTPNPSSTTWDGLGADNDLTTGANWVSNQPLLAGDSPIFAGSTRLGPNNPATLVVGPITFAAGASGFTVGGSRLDLGSGTITNASSNTQTISAPLGLNGTATVATGTSNVTLSGIVSDQGGTGALTKTGAGTLTLNAVNTYSGATTVSAGSLASDAAATVPGTISVANGATVRPGGTGTAGTLSTGALTIASGATYAADVTGAGAADQLSVTGTVTVTNATLAVNSVSAPGAGTSVTIVANDGTSDAVVGTFSGLAEGANITAGTEIYRISYVGGDGNDITLLQAGVPGAPTIGTATAGNTWASVAFTAPASDGGATISSYTVTASPGGASAGGSVSPIVVAGLTNGVSYTFTVTATNAVGTSAASAASNAVAPNPSGTTWDGGGADNLLTTAANWVSNQSLLAGDTPTFAGSTRPLPSNPTLDRAMAGVTFATGASAFTLGGSRIVLAAGSSIIDSAASVTQTISTPVRLNGATTTNVVSTGVLELSGLVDDGTGTGSMVKSGAGTLVLSGTTNTFSGGVTVQDGNFETGASGNVGALTVQASGSFDPASTGTGDIDTGALSIAATGVLYMDILGGTPGTGHDRVDVTGTVNISGAVLSLGNVVAGTPGVTTYTIIRNDGADAVNGTYAGLAEGAHVTEGSAHWTISYTGGDGNDVVLTAVGAPAPPTGVSAVSGNASATVSFTPGASNGVAITGYVVTATPGGATGSGSSSPVAVAGLANGTTYTFTVTATNAAGTGASSSPSAGVVPSTVPDAPTITSAAPGVASASVSFTAGSDNGAAITGYTVTASPGGTTASGSGSPLTINGLTNGTTYTFTVTATNLRGTSAASAPSGPTTPSASITAPGVPEALAATTSSGQVRLTWSAPASDGGSTIQGYRIHVLPNNSTVTVTNGTAARFLGLTNGSQYTFTVRAFNIVGDGAATGSLNVTPNGVGTGYWMLESNGAVHAFGSATDLGNVRSGLGLASAVDLEPIPNGRGYWIVDSIGRVSAFGEATAFGSADRGPFVSGERVTSISSSRTGAGYWLFTTRGRVQAFGDATPYGDVSSLTLNGPVLGSIPTASGNGYYMVGSDGGIFAFGDAVFVGSMGGVTLNSPVQGLVPDRDGRGYWLVASDGGIFAFDATFRGSMGAVRLNRPVVGMVRFGNGYLMVGADGGIFNFSDSQFFGSLGANPPANPVASVAVLES